MSRKKNRVVGPKGQALIFTDRTDVFEWCESGFALERGGWSVTDPEWLKDVKRGEINGFSKAAARRLRDVLLHADYNPQGMAVSGVCLTLPPESEDGDGEAVFGQMNINKRALFGDALVSLIWRKEVQKNGRVHYHCIVWERVPDNRPDLPAESRTARKRWAGTLPVLLVNAWIRGVCSRIASRMRSAGDTAHVARMKVVNAGVPKRMTFVHKGEFEEPDLATAPLLYQGWPCITEIDGPGKGVEYLADHNSKHKAYQAQTKGKAWGVWARKSLPLVEVHREDLSEREGAWMSRVARRLGRYWVKDSRSPWGWRWAKRCKTFQRGRNAVVNPDKGSVMLRWLAYLRGVGKSLVEPNGRASRREP